MNTARIVLIIDDDPDDVEFFTEAVEKVQRGATCYTKTNGQEGMTFLLNPRNPLPDFIFLDLNMPLMNGKQCLREIRRSKRLRNIPVIIYTTSRQKSDEEETKKLGADEFFTKPSRFEDLCSMLLSCFKKYGAQSEA
jgi:CheY-like chemotaxis protein